MAGIDGALGERRARIGALISELGGEMNVLAEDLGYRAWRVHPVRGYRRPVLTVNRQRARPTTSAANLLADLHAIAESSSGTVNGDRPRRQLTTADFAKTGRLVVAGDAVHVARPIVDDREAAVEGVAA